MRALLLIPIALLLTAGVGYTACRMLGWEPHLLEMIQACGIAVVATIAALLVLWINRSADQPAAAQAGLVATTIHLFMAVALAGVMILLVKPSMAFTYWLFAFYWMTLFAVAYSSVRLIRSAPIQKASRNAGN
jgi:nitrate reductase gamma subunit